MKITPLEIRQKTFEKVFRGYDKDEVGAYLQSLSQEWERVIDENKEMSIRIESLEKEVSKLREVESSLFKTLKTAEDTGANLIEQARKETELKIKQSNFQSEEIISQARERAKLLLDRTEVKTKQILDEMMSRVKSLESQYNQVYDLREKLVEQIRNYSEELNERVNKFEKKSEEHQVKDLVKEARDIYHHAIVDLDTTVKQEVGKKTNEDQQDAPVVPEQPAEGDMEEVQTGQEEKNKTGSPLEKGSKSFFDELD